MREASLRPRARSGRVEEQLPEPLVGREPQPVPRLDLASALADIARRPFEAPHPLEAALAGM